MNISKALQAAGLPINTGHYYADIRLVNPAWRTQAGYRYYRDARISKLAFIRRSLEFRFSIDRDRDGSRARQS
jgi:MerR family copper efflux transcriptional regulator